MAKIESAKAKFAGTEDAERLTLAEAGLLAKQGFTDNAIDRLASILPESSYFLQAKLQQAQFALKHRRDQETFIDVTYKPNYICT